MGVEPPKATKPQERLAERTSEPLRGAGKERGGCKAQGARHRMRRASEGRKG